MKKYKTRIINIQKDIPFSLICDKCKKEYFFEEDYFEIQEFHFIKFRGGYSSVFGDLSNNEYDICQHCLYKWLTVSNKLC